MQQGQSPPPGTVSRRFVRGTAALAILAGTLAVCSLGGWFVFMRMAASAEVQARATWVARAEELGFPKGKLLAYPDLPRRRDYVHESSEEVAAYRESATKTPEMERAIQEDDERMNAEEEHRHQDMLRGLAEGKIYLDSEKIAEPYFQLASSYRGRAWLALRASGICAIAALVLLTVRFVIGRPRTFHNVIPERDGGHGCD